MLVLDIILTLISRLLRAAANLGLLALVARALGKEELGRYFFSLNVALPLSFFMAWGVGMAVVRAVSFSHNGEGRLVHHSALNTVFAANAGVGVFSLCLGGMAAFVLVHVPLLSDALLVIFLCGVAVSSALLNLQGECFRAVGGYRQSSFYANTAPSLLVLLITAGWILFVPDVGLKDILLACVLGNSVVLLLSSISLFRVSSISGGFIDFKTFPSVFLDLFKVGAANLAGSAMGVFLPSGAVILAGYLYGAQGSAEIGLAQRVLFFVSLPLWVASTVLPPKISKLISLGKSVELQRLFSIIMLGSACLGVGLASLVTAFASEIIYLISGAHFHSAARTLQVLVWGSAIYAIFGVAIFTVMVSKENHSLFASLGMALAVFVMGVVFSHFATDLGSLGVGVSQNAAMLTHAFYCLYIIKKSEIGKSLPNRESMMLILCDLKGRG